MRPRTIFFGVCAALALTGGVAFVLDWDVDDGAFVEKKRDYNHPPPGQRPIIEPPDKSSSACIGKPTTPVCAVETMMACLIWQRPDLCRLVRDVEVDRVETQYLTRPYRLEYNVVEIRRAVPDDWNRSRFALMEYSDLVVRMGENATRPFDPRAVVVNAYQRACAIEAPEECAELLYDGTPRLLLSVGKFFVGDTLSEGFSWFEYILIPDKGRWKIIWSDSSGTIDRIDLKLGNSDKISVGAIVPLEPDDEGDPS